MAGDADARFSIGEFFKETTHDLYTSLYVAIGGSLEEDSHDWASRVADLVSTGIKILILLLILGSFYWLLTYALKHNQERLHLGEKGLNILRSVLRYFWIISCIIAIMSQLNVSPLTIKATAKASIWAGIYYVLWSSSGHIINRVLRHYGLNASIEQLLKNVLSVIIIILGLASVMAQFGFDIISLVAGLGIVGIAVSFAAQSTLADFIAGITILLEQSFQVGDWISIDNNEGRVVLISLRTTHVLTRNNVTVIIPNSNVASSKVINITSKNFIRFDVHVRIALEASIADARTVILGVIADNEMILKRPEPSATIEEISDFGAVFIVRFWVTPSTVARIPSVKEALTEHIKNELQAAGISIPYPHMRILLPKDVDNVIDQNKPFATKSFEVTTPIAKDSISTEK